MFETQSKERVLSSDQLSKSIYSSFFVDVVVIITVDTMLTYRQRERERVQRRKKPAKSRGKRQRKQGRDKKKCNFPSSMWNDQCSEGKREREREHDPIVSLDRSALDRDGTLVRARKEKS